MSTRLFSIRGVAALSAVPLLLVGCSTTAQRPAASSSAPVSAPSSASSVPMAGPLPAPGTPAPPACGAGPEMLSSMSTRDKLAQVLMVGVKSATDARNVVDSYHVGGIFIGSWTDLTMLTDGSLADYANAGPLPLAVSVDEEGGRVERL